MKEHSLLELAPGEWGIVQKLSGKTEAKQRMQDLGLIPGTRVVCLQRSPLGDPTAYDIRGAVIALRKEDSVKIKLK